MLEKEPLSASDGPVNADYMDLISASQLRWSEVYEEGQETMVVMCRACWDFDMSRSVVVRRGCEIGRLWFRVLPFSPGISYPTLLSLMCQIGRKDHMK